MEWVRKWGVITVVGVVGIGLLFFGFWDEIKPREVRVEILHRDTVSQCHGESCRHGGEIIVDVAGAGEKPGVYKMATDSRIGDALVLAGGLAASADREWVAATLNLAEKLEDGEKIFIPRQSENSDIQNTQRTRESEIQKNQKVNINNASVSELDSLEGIGEARARVIIDNRPYSKTEELVSKAKIPQSVYDKISSNISVY
ncbi:MAG: hypothetical protein E6R05_04105 [Candidatus Moraniibacteriota bacterium]|nr:MAG: hypothetical protein E6R05_04105 [Candidatus Moranbacteria bacterium]